MRKLDLSSSNLSDGSCVLLADTLKSFKSMESVSVKGNAIDSLGANSLLSLARECPNITSI